MNKATRWCWTAIVRNRDPVTYKLLYKFIRFRIGDQEKDKSCICCILSLQCIVDSTTSHWLRGSDLRLFVG